MAPNSAIHFHARPPRRIHEGKPRGPRMDTPHERDEFLMFNVSQGQRAPLEALVRRYGSALLTFIRRMVGDAHRSEELFQDVFLAVWTRRHQYQYPRSFKNWLYAIALNKCREA